MRQAEATRADMALLRWDIVRRSLPFTVAARSMTARRAPSGPRRSGPGSTHPVQRLLTSNNWRVWSGLKTTSGTPQHTARVPCLRQELGADRGPAKSDGRHRDRFSVTAADEV